MSRFKHLVDSPASMEGFKARYHIPQGVSLQYCAPDQVLTHRNEGDFIILMIAFIAGGMTLPMGRVTRDYLIAHRLCPHQCAPNLFRVLGNVDAFNKQMGLRRTNVIHSLTQGITSSLGPQSLSSYSVFPSPIGA